MWTKLPVVRLLLGLAPAGAARWTALLAAVAVVLHSSMATATKGHFAVDSWGAGSW